MISKILMENISMTNTEREYLLTQINTLS